MPEQRPAPRRPVAKVPAAKRPAPKRPPTRRAGKQTLGGAAADARTVAAIEAEAARVEARLAKRSPDELPPTPVIAKLGRVEVEELDGSRTRLGSTWDESPAALVFLRHYG